MPNLQSHLLVFVDGHFQPALSGGQRRFPKASTSVIWIPCCKKIATCVINGLAPRGQDAFVELNTAFLRDGVHVHISVLGLRLDVPIEVLFIATSPNVAAHPRLWVRVEEGAQATLIERYVSTSEGAHLTNSLAEFSVGENAHLDHYRVQNENRAAFHIANLYVREERHSVFRSTCLTLGGLHAQSCAYAWWREGVDSTLNGLYLVEDQQHVDNHTLIEHAQPHCQSHEFYKGILADDSTGVFRGQILVHQAAQKTDAYQANRNLLLSDRAEINTKPQLEIYADDVKCSHGATIGQLDEDAIFYLRSRGIGRAAARQVLTRAFAGEVVERIRLEPLRLQLENHVGERLERL